ncbi:MAG TPA: metal ABC transporter substrate-binding protein, partial [Mobilitalea sp.]|nr:metal ABC transporter substrate-binding protein [Mobilitalea sp.]
NSKGDKEVNKNEAKLQVVTSFYPTYILALNVTDEVPGIQVDSLTDFSAGCLHDYQLTTGDMKRLSSADVFLMNGGGMEGYIEEVVKNFPDLAIIDISEGITMIESDEHEGELNPHVWLDPERYSLQISNATKGLIGYINDNQVAQKLDAQTIDAETIDTETIDTDTIDMETLDKQAMISKLTANAEDYTKKVLGIEESLELLLAEMLEHNKQEDVVQRVVIFHEAFAYIAARAELETAFTVEMEGDTALSATEIAGIIKLIQQDEIEYLFTEQQYGDTITDRIEEETGIQAYVIDSAVTGDGTKDSYLESMEKNLETLRTAFQIKE